MTPFRFRFSSDLPIYPKKYFSHLLIIICVIIAIVWFISPDFLWYFGLHRLPLIAEAIPYFVWQIIFFQFLHGDILHLLMNGYFLYSAWPEVESRMSRKRFITFFLTSTLFTAIWLYIFASAWSLTIGISGFCMALLSYLWLDLSRIKHPQANQILIMLILNIALGLTGNISFVGHAAGAIWGIIWWQFFRDKKGFASIWR